MYGRLRVVQDESPPDLGGTAWARGRQRYLTSCGRAGDQEARSHWRGRASAGTGQPLRWARTSRPTHGLLSTSSARGLGPLATGATAQIRHEVDAVPGRDARERGPGQACFVHADATSQVTCHSDAVRQARCARGHKHARDLRPPRRYRQGFWQSAPCSSAAAASRAAPQVSTLRRRGSRTSFPWSSSPARPALRLALPFSKLLPPPVCPPHAPSLSPPPPSRVLPPRE